MKRFFTVTSPDNSLAVTIYAMFAFYAVTFLFEVPTGPVKALGTVWSTVLLISSSAALYATLSSPRRRNPDRSLIIEHWASVTLCILMGWFLIVLMGYRTSAGGFAINTFGLVLIFFVGFACRSWQVKADRKSLAKFRRDHGPTVK